MYRHGVKLFLMISATRFNQERVFNLTSTLQLAGIAVYTGMRVQLQAMDSTRDPDGRVAATVKNTCCESYYFK